MIARILALGVWIACGLLVASVHQSRPAIIVADRDETILYLAALEARIASIELEKMRRVLGSALIESGHWVTLSEGRT